jgi:hypothetical protein
MEDPRLAGFTLVGRSLIAELLARVAALEHAVGNPVEGELLEAEERDPVQAGFEAYRGRARQIEDRRERKEQAP